MNQTPAKTGLGNVYIIDKNYRVVYYNKLASKMFPTLKQGDLCFQCLFGRTSPCANCLLSSESPRSMVTYNPLIQKWMEISCAPIDWPEYGECTMMVGNEINESSKNLFYNLTGQVAYDELFELNLTQQNYKILFHEPDKYVIPPTAGDLLTMRTDVAEHMIHPDDKQNFLSFWNMDVLLHITEADHTIRSAEFRKLKTDGSYCWVSQLIVPLRQSDSEDLLILCFIQDINTFKENESRIQAEYEQYSLTQNKLTGLPEKEYFVQNASILLINSSSEEFCVMAIDIEHFKLFNEWYGKDAGDQFLIDIGLYLQKLHEHPLISAGYMGGDDFVLLLPNKRSLIREIQEYLIHYARRQEKNVGFRPVFGLYSVTEQDVSVNTMYDRALIALSSIKGNYALHEAWYNETMKVQMEDDQILLSDIQRALEEREFVFYGQPKCDMRTGKIIGIEALIRWIHPNRGLIPPMSFIPLLEKTGFIARVDLYVWDMVCRKLQEWIRCGRRPMPIAVNVSRVDIYSIDIVKTFQDLIQKYQLDPSLLQIEITESAYIIDYTLIPEIVNKLRNLGFVVFMDDFGSGYSSLNMLKDVNVDVIKIDTKFLELSELSAGKGFGILDAIIKMAKLMHISVIAEGVETKEHVDFLLNIGCVYGQGYYYYRPLPMSELESLLLDENLVDFGGMEDAHTIEQLQLEDFFHENFESDQMLNNLLGGVAFYDIHDGLLELLRVNDQYYQVTGDVPFDLKQHQSRILEMIHEDDRAAALSIFRNAVTNPATGSSGDIRRYRADGSLMWMHLRIFFIRRQDGHEYYYGTVMDITPYMENKSQ